MGWVGVGVLHGSWGVLWCQCQLHLSVATSGNKGFVFRPYTKVPVTSGPSYPSDPACSRWTQEVPHWGCPRLGTLEVWVAPGLPSQAARVLKVYWLSVSCEICIVEDLTLSAGVDLCGPTPEAVLHSAPVALPFSGICPWGHH